jgi:hypothetical protein
VFDAKMARGAMNGSDLAVEVLLPVHTLRDRLDHQIAALELLEVVVVVRRLDVAGVVDVDERRRAQLLQALHGRADHAVLRALFAR